MELNQTPDKVNEEPKVQEEIVTPETELTNELRRMGKFSDDPSDFTFFLRKSLGQQINDPTAGTFTVKEDTYNFFNELNSDLGRAAGLMRDNGKYEGTPQRIVDEVFDKIGNASPQFQSVYRDIALRYIDNKIKELKN